MKISSGSAPRPELDRAKAWSCLVTNLLVLPGLGSAMARRKSGYIQMLLAFGGFGVTLSALVRIMVEWAREFLLPDDPGLYKAAIAGIGVFLVAWVWSLLTSLALFRELR